MKEEVDEDEEIGAIQTYSEYRPAKLNLPGWRQHPDKVVESTSLTSVELPDVQRKTYQNILIGRKVIEEGCLSALQLEAIAYSIQAHQKILPNGQRTGFFIGKFHFLVFHIFIEHIFYVK